MIVPSQLALKTHTNLGCAASFAFMVALSVVFMVALQAWLARLAWL
jgi:hypothetical protein